MLSHLPAHAPLGLALLSGLVVGSPLAARAASSPQQGDEPTAPQPDTPVRVESVAGPLSGVLPEPEPDFEREAVVQGPFRERPVLDRDDEVPAAGEDVLVAGPDGDVRVRAADGDPFFLGFAAGPYHPAAGERVDPELIERVARAHPDGRPDDVVYAFVMFARRITPARIAELEGLGLRTLGRHPHHSLKVALPTSRLDAVASLSFVRWVGLARTWQKVHPALARELESASAGAELDVWVSLFEDDLNADSPAEPAPVFETFDPAGAVQAPGSLAPAAGRRTGGWQERELEARGLELFEYVEASRSFRARATRALLDEVVALDFVQFVSPVVAASAAHDESMPLIHADARRSTYDGGNDQAVVVGVVDSGITIGHDGFAPIWAAGWDFTGEGAGAWVDGREHGSHVAGTVLGRGGVEDSWAGAAPGLGAYGPTGRLFNYKMIDSNDSTAGVNWNTLYTYMSQGWTDGNGNATPKPHILNHSWGSDPVAGGWFGTEPQAVAFDGEVFDNRQLHVFAAHNFGPSSSTISLQGSAKNVLTVGGVVDFSSFGNGLPGTLWNGSSRGPTADNRWKPNVVAPATSILSIDPQTDDDYAPGTGTSMAAPHVTGLAAQLLDHYPFLRTRPATTAATLMATALTKDDAAIGTPGTAHLDQYGAGRVEGSRIHGSNSQQDLYFWAWSSAGGSSTIDVDVTVGSGATRMTAVMVYHEQAASVGASKALVNDWDMWIDAAPFSPAGNAGEYFAQQSTLNNVELRSINSPASNTYRIKLYPEDVTGTCRMGLAVSVVYGDTTPDGSLSVSASDAYVKPNEEIVFTASAYNPSFYASSVFLNSSSTIGSTLVDATSTLKDGATASYVNNAHDGRDVLVGNIRYGQSRAVDWRVRWASEGTKTWSVDADSDNWVDKTAQVQVVVDGTSPSLVTNLSSPSHTPDVWSNDDSIDFAWTPASDNLAGVDGYGIYISNAPTGAPGATKDLGAVSSYSTVLATDSLPHYFKIRTVDRSGNWTPDYATTGGYLIDTQNPKAAGSLQSTSHQVGVTDCDLVVDMTWDASLDLHSGLDGYIAVWNHAPFTTPISPPNVAGNATSYSQTLADGDDWYFHLRPVDAAGNVGSTVHAGPYSIDSTQWTTYCTSKVSSNFCTPTIGASGPASLAAPGGFVVTTTQVEAGVTGVTFFGLTGPNANPFQGGFLCVTAPLYRMAVQGSGGAGICSGSLSYTLADMLAHSSGGALISAGTQANLQTWFRDPPAATSTGLSNGLEVHICP